MEISSHVPVLLEEVTGFLMPNSDSSRQTPRVFFDGTLGGGGHSEAFLKRDDELRLVGFDRDSQAVDRARARLRPFAGRSALFAENFRNLHRFLASRAAEWCGFFPELPAQSLLFDGVLLDLGFSSDQMGDSARGFSFSDEAPLDMRMTPAAPLTAEAVVNGYSLRDLLAVFRRGGVGESSMRLARAVVDQRPVLSTRDLAAICCAVAVKRHRRARRSESAVCHPATVPFQAIRIEVNDELGALRAFLGFVPRLMAPKGRLVVISFHSLEDALVARAMRSWSRSPSVPKGFPQQMKPLGALLTPKAIRPNALEVAANPRSRSARLRVFERRREEGSVCHPG